MRFALLVLATLALATWTADARADNGQPSAETLAEMGLSGIHVVSDSEASSVRGSGYYWGGAYRYRLGIYKFHSWVKKYHNHVKSFHNRIAKKHYGYSYGYYGKSSHKPSKRW